MTDEDREQLSALLAQPDLAGDRRGHGLFVPAEDFPTIESRRRAIYAPILTAWAQRRHLETDPDPVLLKPWMTWRVLLKRA